MPPPPPPAQARRPTPLWRNLSFALMWTSIAASGFGDRLIQLGAWAMLGIDGAGAQASSIQAAVYFFFFLPYLVLTPIGGYLADTLGRKWIMLGCDEARAGLLLLALLLAPAGAAAVIPVSHQWKVYALILAVGACAAVFSPTRNATVPQIVPRHQLQAANAVILGIAVIASMIGLMVGGRLVEWYSVRAGLGVGVGLFLVSGLFFAFLKLRPGHGGGVRPPVSQWRRLIEAAGYVRVHRPVAELVLLSVLFWGAANVFMAALAALAKHRYGIPADQLKSSIADLGGLTGLGMLAGALGVAWLNTRRETNWLAMLCLLGASVAMAVIAVNPWYEAALALAFVTGMFGNAAMIIVATLTQSLSPNYIRGRVFGVRDLANTASAVAVNLGIWRMPQADDAMVPVLYAMAAVLGGVSLWGLWRGLTAGPLGDRLANAMWHVIRLFDAVWHRAVWLGRHHVPSRGAVILASNHTVGLDPFLIQAGCGRLVRWLMISSYRYRLAEPLWRACDPIMLEPDNGNLVQIRAVLEALKQGQAVGLFPEGRLQRTERELGPLQQGLGMIARRSGAAIVPVWIEGTPRKQHMLWHFLWPSRSTVVYGPAYRPAEGASAEAIVEELRQRMLRLRARARERADGE